MLPEEKERPQPFEVDLDLDMDLSRAADTDDLSDTVNYGAVAESVTAVITEGRFALLEAMAGRVADAVLEEPAVSGVIVTVRKLRPPVSTHLNSSGVRLERRRP